MLQVYCHGHTCINWMPSAFACGTSVSSLVGTNLIDGRAIMVEVGHGRLRLGLWKSVAQLGCQFEALWPADLDRGSPLCGFGWASLKGCAPLWVCPARSKSCRASNTEQCTFELLMGRSSSKPTPCITRVIEVTLPLSCAVCGFRLAIAPRDLTSYSPKIRAVCSKQSKQHS